MDYAEQLLKGVDYVIAARLQEHKFDETIICTVVDDTKASEGLYVVSDGTIKFDAYSESVDYKVDQAVRVNIPKGDYSQKKYIVGKAVSEKNGNQPIVYRAPSAQILDLTDNVFSKGSGRSWSIYANGGQREKLIQSINLRDQYGGLIYDTLYLKANFKTIFNQYAMCSGGYGIYIIATMASKDSSGKQNQRIYYFDSKHMFGNPYNYLISSSQETKFFIGKDESITNIAIYLYQDNSFKYKDSKGTIQTYSKSSLAEDIIVSDIYISLGADLTQVEDNKVEIQTTESLNYNDPQTDVDNTKIIRLQWYNKDENNQYIGFSDGVVPHFEDRKFLFIGDSYGVGINSESWQGWPYYAAMNMDFTHPSSGGVYPPQSGATRYINADPDWSQWIAIAQSGVGFAATSRHNPKTEISGNEDNSDHDYNFAELVSKANSILHTAKGNGTEANNLPSLPAGVSQYSEVLDDVTDIVVAADGWSDMWYDKEGSDPSDNEDDSDPEDIALGIINLIRNAKARCSQKLKRIYIFGIGSCDDNYKIKNEQGEDISNTDYARNILNQTYSQYANIISKLNNCEPINIQKNDDGTYVTKTFTRRESGVLQILQNATSNNDYYDCPQIVFYDIHDILNSDDFKNDKSDNEYIREKDDGKHPSKSGYEKIGREIAKRTCLVESELQYSKRLNEHNRIVRQMEKDGVPDDYVGFELSARYEEIKDLKTTLINLINIDLYNEIKNFQYALNGKAKDEFTNWLNQLKGVNGDSGIANDIIVAFNGSEQELGLLNFYKNGLDFAKKVQDDLVYWDWDQKKENKKYFLKSDDSELTKQLGLRKIENLLLGKIADQDQTLYTGEGQTIPEGYLITLKNSINNKLSDIEKAIQSDVNLGSIYDGYKIRIEKIRDKIITETVRLKKLSCGNLYSIDVDLDNTAGNDTMVNYYTSWYLFEDPAHPENDKNGRGLLTHRIRHHDQDSKVSFIKTTYDPNKFDTKPNRYAISWYYYRNGYRAQEGENNLGGNDWCAIEDPGVVNGKSRFTVFNTNDNIGLPTAERNETTNKLEYPKKPRVDDPNSYLSISFSKERPDIKQEKIKAILTYNHEKYESNIITFENKDPAAGPELTNGIQIVHGSNSQAVYPLYGVDNTLIRASDENTKRQLKVQYLNERGEPESGNETVLKGASIYWYVPTYATMLRTEDIDLVSSSGQAENFVKSSAVEWEFTVAKQMITETEKEYVDSCTLTYITKRPTFKSTFVNSEGIQQTADFYLFNGYKLRADAQYLTDGGKVAHDQGKKEVTITYTYTYKHNDEHKKFYINTYNGKGTNDPSNWDVPTPLINGGITYSISEDGKYIIASNNTRYFINSSKKVTLPIDAIDNSDQKGYDCYYKRIEDVSDLTFTYRIKDYYSASFKNNTIKCKIIKGNQQLEGSISMDFNSYGSNGTNYSLIIKPVTWNVVWEQPEDSDKKLLKNTYSFEIMLFDYENKQIPFNNKPTITLKSVKNEFGTEVFSSPSASNEAGILSYLTNNIEISHTSYVPQILQVTAKQPWPIDSDTLVTLEAYYPIPFKRESGLLADIPTTIVYDSFGSNPSYYKNALCLYDNDGNLKTDAAWSIQYYSENGDITDSIPNRIKSFLPQIKGNSQNGSAMLLPSNMYVSNCDDIQVVLRCAYATDPDQTWWLQPILLYQNRYPSTMLNNWDGELKIDEDNNTILANIVGAGKKESDNSFSGVLMGEVENADVPTDTARNALQHPHTGLGLYGFHQGEQSFGFNVNGTAFIGKSGGGRIAFDGNRGIIHSTNWLYNKGTNTLRTQIFNNNKELMPGSQGMAIDLQNGHIDAYNFKLSSAGIQLNSDPPAGGDYIYIGPNDSTRPHIRYSENGGLEVKVDSLAITGTIGGQNLLNNTAPRETPLLTAAQGNASIGFPSLYSWTLAKNSGDILKIGERKGKRWILLQKKPNTELNQGYRQMWNNIRANEGEYFEPGVYTLSGLVYCNQSRTITFRLGHYDVEEGPSVIQTISIAAGEDKEINLTFHITETTVDKMFHIYETFSNAVPSATWFHHLKLEKGSYATAWNESEQDIADKKINRKNLLFNTGPIEAEMLEANKNEETNIEHWRLFNSNNKLRVRRTSDNRRWLLLSGNEDFKPENKPIIHRRQVWQALDGTKTTPIKDYDQYFNPGFYTLSGVAMCAKPRNITFGLGYYGDQQGNNLTAEMVLTEGQEKEFAYTFYVESAKSIKSIFHIYDTSDGETGDNAYSSSTHFHHLKLEYGSWATPWDPDVEDDGLTQYLNQKKIFNSLTNNGKAKGIWMDDYDSDGTTDLYINADYIATGVISSSGDTGMTINLDDGTINSQKFKLRSWAGNTKNYGGVVINNEPEPGASYFLVGNGLDNDSSYVQFYKDSSTKNGILKIQTPNFTLNENGDVEVEGSITAKGGKSFNLRADDTANHRTVLLANDPSTHGWQSYFYIGDQSNYIKYSIDDKLIINADNFKLDASGNVSVTGDITATDGTIGGCKIINNSLQIKKANIAEKLTANEIDVNNLTVKTATVAQSITIQNSSNEILFSAGNNLVTMGGFTVGTASIHSNNNTTFLNSGGTFSFTHDNCKCSFIKESNQMIFRAESICKFGSTIYLGSTNLTEDTLTKLNAIDYDNIVYQGEEFEVETGHGKYNQSLRGYLANIYNRIYALEG